MKRLLSDFRRHLNGRVGLVAGLAAAVVFAVAMVPAMAAPSEDDATSTPMAAAGPAATPVQKADQRLEKLFQQEQKALDRGQKAVGKANDAAAKAQTRIDGLKQKGQDTSALEAALATFKAAVASAQSSLDSASAILNARAGFGTNGQVIDAAQARTTVQTAGKAEREALQALRKAVRTYRSAVRERTEANQLANEQKTVARGQQRLDKAGEVAARVQSMVDAQKAKGKDTSSVESALADFKTAITSAQSSLDSAKATLDAHAGFDTNGQVTDQALARTTLDTARKALRAATQTVSNAGRALREAIREFRQASKS